MSSYIQPLSKLTSRETLVALTLARLGPGPHAIGAVARELGVKAPDISSTRASLVRKHIVSAPVAGQLKFRMPSTDRFMLAHEAEYDTPDVQQSRDERKSKTPCKRGEVIGSNDAPGPVALGRDLDR